VKLEVEAAEILALRCESESKKPDPEQSCEKTADSNQRTAPHSRSRSPPSAALPSPATEVRGNHRESRNTVSMQADLIVKTTKRVYYPKGKRDSNRDSYRRESQVQPDVQRPDSHRQDSQVQPDVQRTSSQVQPHAPQQSVTIEVADDQSRPQMVFIDTAGRTTAEKLGFNPDQLSLHSDSPEVLVTLWKEKQQAYLEQYALPVVHSSLDTAREQKRLELAKQAPAILCL